MTAGELKSRGYYQGSNVSYNLKKLVELGYMHHQRCDADRKSVRVKLTFKGRDVRQTLEHLFNAHSEKMQKVDGLSESTITTLTQTLKELERFWTLQIRYIY